MQIILTQTEIEEALRQSVLQQIALREGQEITFDFKATRGEDGLTATIQISAPQQIEVKVEPKTEKVTPEKATPRNISEEPEDRKEPEADEQEDGSSEEDNGDAKPSIFPTEGTSAPLAEPEPEVAPEVAAKSLFANLTKPVNGAK